MLTQALQGKPKAQAVLRTRPAMKVVVCVDGSVHSQARAELVRALPLTAGSEVAVLVASTSEPRLGALLNSSLEQATARLVHDDVQLTKSTVAGPTAQHVIAYAGAFEADLVVVSAQPNSSDVGALLNKLAQLGARFLHLAQTERRRQGVDGMPRRLSNRNDFGICLAGRSPIALELTGIAQRISRGRANGQVIRAQIFQRAL
jgi:nucleotide-binding universal stress UspA family protein